MGIFLKDMNLKGKTALITGATKGLGRGASEAIAFQAADTAQRFVFALIRSNKSNFNSKSNKNSLCLKGN